MIIHYSPKGARIPLFHVLLALYCLPSFCICFYVYLGKILGVETLSFKCQETNTSDKLNTETSVWSECGNNARIFLQGLRIFYLVGQPAYETLGRSDWRRGKVDENVLFCLLAGLTKTFLISIIILCSLHVIMVRL